MTYVTLGTIYKATGKMLKDSEGNEYPEMVALDGYAVNVIDDGSVDVSAYVVTPTTPYNVFAGRADDTTFLTFKDRDEWLSLGIEKEEADG